MSMSLNKVTILGHVGKDPEFRALPDGSRVCTFSVATSESWTDKKTQERREVTEWHKVNVMNDNLVEIIEQKLSKGSRVYLEGQLKTNKWNDRDGKEKTSTEVYLGKFRGVMIILDKVDLPPHPENVLKSPKMMMPKIEIKDDEIPF